MKLNPVSRSSNFSFYSKFEKLLSKWVFGGELGFDFFFTVRLLPQMGNVSDIEETLDQVLKSRGLRLFGREVGLCGVCLGRSPGLVEPGREGSG